MSPLRTASVPNWFSRPARRGVVGIGAIVASMAFAGSAQAHPYIGIRAPVQAASSTTQNFSAATHIGRSRVRNVTFYVDGRRIFLDRATPWTVPGGVDTRRLSNGRHRLRARVLFRNGATRVAEKVISVRNRRPTPAAATPKVSWSTPTAGKVVSGDLRGDQCQVVVDRPSAVTRVDFALDGRFIGDQHAGPYNCELNTTSVSDGSHTLTAIAYDKYGRSSRASTEINVSNRAPAPGDPSPPPVDSSPPPGDSSPPPVDPFPPPTDLLAQLGFESGDLSGWQLIQRTSADRIRVVDSPVRSGSRAARFEVRSGDDFGGGGARSEIGYTENMASEGEVRTYSWSTFVPEDYPSVDKWQDILQWKNEGTGSPPLQMKIEGEQIGLSGGPQVNWRWPWKRSLERGRWLDFKVRTMWSSDPQVGWVEAWYEGEKVLERHSMATLYPGLKNYLKMGLYRDSSISQTGVIFHDGLTISAG